MEVYVQSVDGRWGFLKPLYSEFRRGNSISIGLGEGPARQDIIKCGQYFGTTEVDADAAYFHALRVLRRWGEWLSKARVGTLRWLAEHPSTTTVAGDPYRNHRATASVRSQLERAELVTKSEFWGREVSTDVLYLRIWAECELKYRGKA